MPIKLIPADDYESKREPEAFALENPFEIERWMCNNCGLIFDFHKEDSPGYYEDQFGWPEFIVYNWVDGDGELNFEEEMRCPRCNIDLKKKPLVSITVSLKGSRALNGGKR